MTRVVGPKMGLLLLARTNLADQTQGKHSLCSSHPRTDFSHVCNGSPSDSKRRIGFDFSSSLAASCRACLLPLRLFCFGTAHNIGDEDRRLLPFFPSHLSPFGPSALSHRFLGFQSEGVASTSSRQCPQTAPEAGAWEGLQHGYGGKQRSEQAEGPVCTSEQ